MNYGRIYLVVPTCPISIAEIPGFVKKKFCKKGSGRGKILCDRNGEICEEQSVGWEKGEEKNKNAQSRHNCEDQDLQAAGKGTFQRARQKKSGCHQKDIEDNIERKRIGLKCNMKEVSDHQHQCGQNWQSDESGIE